MTFIVKINTYYGDQGIEIHEEELVSGTLPSGRPQYTAMVTIKVKVSEDEHYPQPISVKFHAIGIEDAFKKAVKELDKEIKMFEIRAEKARKEAIAAAAVPRIITDV
jgi:hypothetical protein